MYRNSCQTFSWDLLWFKVCSHNQTTKKTSIIGLFHDFSHRQKISDAIPQTDWRSQKAQGFGCSFKHIGVVLSQRLGSLRTKRLCRLFHGLAVSQQRSDPWGDHRISKRLIVGLDNLVTLTLYKLARLLSDAELCTHDRIYFKTQPNNMVCKMALFRRTLGHCNWECVWNRVSDAFSGKTWTREST